MSGNKENLKEVDIELYLRLLEDGWLSEDGILDQDSDDEHYDADEIVRVLQHKIDDNDADDSVDVRANVDPPLLDPEEMEPSHS